VEAGWEARAVANDYIINGVTMPCPSTGHWVARKILDIQGDNRPIYGPVREFEISWTLTSYEDWEILVATFNKIQSTGTAVVELPAYPTITGTAFAFGKYSGCTLHEPEVGPAFNMEYPTNVALLIGNIRTS
jgi:hypothetical protein